MIQQRPTLLVTDDEEQLAHLGDTTHFLLEPFIAPEAELQSHDLAPENALQMVTFAGLNMKAARSSIVSEDQVHNLDATLSESDLSSIAESDLVSLHGCDRVWNFLTCLLVVIFLSGGMMILTVQSKPESRAADALLGFLFFGLVENFITRTYTYYRFGVSATNEFVADGCKIYAIVYCMINTIIATVVV